ncbi:hypothetical protein K402DRAFT_467365 [Aulographum hederae CBS 113979]|uniref:Heterokaryon incompatibility domain-containing protein n=1 Tax=Aulographum hederae CBS 113979 TaxID=1176131 RepID=A0A6G1GLU3_9PEZI|nr:hypothetical protein K402DRAFT_467365 [Aulographum hederae CBS 113979]
MELWFECEESSWCECGINPSNQGIWTKNNKGKTQTTVPGTSQRATLMDEWHTIEDRCNILGDYLAGLWRNTLIDDMLWSLHPDSLPKQRPDQYIAPTWSWASIIGATLHDSSYFTTSPRLQSLCQVLYAGTTPKSGTPLGQLSAGYILMRGKLVESSWTMVKQKGKSSSEPGSPRLKELDLEFRPDYDLLTAARHSVPQNDLQYILPVGISKSRANGSEDQLRCLVLRKINAVVKAGLKTFERIRILATRALEGKGNKQKREIWDLQHIDESEIVLT